MVDLERILADLISINSINSYYEGGPGEGALAEYVQGFFEDCGIATDKQLAIPASHLDPLDRSNVLAVLPSEGSVRRLVLEAHMDTVSVQGMTIPPFDPVVREGRMFGRGACDTKAGLAAMMVAMAEVQAEGLNPPCEVLLAAVVDEEYSFKGVQRLCQGLQADGAIVAEPTGLKVVVASKGVLRWRVRVKGKAAHSAKWHLGVNAINHMARVVLAFEEDHRRLQSDTHPLLGAASCNVGVIRGGVQVNFVPDECVVEIDRRLLPNENAADVLAGYERILSELAREYPDLQAAMEPPMLVDPAWAVSTDAAIVRNARNVALDLGLDDRLTGVPFGSDASKLGRAGVPTIIFGPGDIDQAHAEVEFVDLAQVHLAKQFYKGCILSWAQLSWAQPRRAWVD